VAAADISARRCAPAPAPPSPPAARRSCACRPSSHSRIFFHFVAGSLSWMCAGQDAVKPSACVTTALDVCVLAGAPDEKNDLIPDKTAEPVLCAAAAPADEPAVPFEDSRRRTCGHWGYHFLYSVQGSSLASQLKRALPWGTCSCHSTTLDPRPSTLDPRPSTLDPRPSTLDPNHHLRHVLVSLNSSQP
jgi:hypothetical protein